MQKLQAGIGQLREGAGGLAEGARQLVEGARRLDESAAKLLDGARELYDGTSKLYTGASSVSSGAGNLSSALAALAAQGSDLTDGAYEVFKALTAQAETQLNATLQAAGRPTVTLTPENYGEVLTNLLDQFSLGAYSRSEARKSRMVDLDGQPLLRDQATLDQAVAIAGRLAPLLGGDRVGHFRPISPLDCWAARGDRPLALVLTTCLPLPPEWHRVVTLPLRLVLALQATAQLAGLRAVVAVQADTDLWWLERTSRSHRTG